MVGNDAIQNAAAHIIEQAAVGMDTAVGFLQAQLPDVVHQLLMWKLTLSGVLFLVGMILLVGGLYSCAASIRGIVPSKNRRQLKIEAAVLWGIYMDTPVCAPTGATDEERVAFHNRAKQAHDASCAARKKAAALDDDSMEGFYVVGAVFSGFVALFGVTLLPNIAWLQILIAPKIYLLEYAAQLIGGGK